MALIINGKIITEKDETKKIADNSSGGGGGSYTFEEPLTENNNNVSLNIDNDKIIIDGNKLTVSNKKFMEYRDYITSISGDTETQLINCNIGDKLFKDNTLIINLVASDWSTYPLTCTVQLQWNKNGSSTYGWIKLLIDWKEDESQRQIFLQHFEDSGFFETHTFFNAWGDDEGPYVIPGNDSDYWELAAITGDNSGDYKDMNLFKDLNNMYIISDGPVTTREQYNRNFIYSVNWGISGNAGDVVEYAASNDEFDRIEDFALLFDTVTHKLCYVTARYKEDEQYYITYVIIAAN